MAHPAYPDVPSKVLRFFIGLDEPKPIVRSYQLTTKYPTKYPRESCDRLVTTMHQSNTNPSPKMSQSQVGPSSVTMGRNPNATTSSGASVVPIDDIPSPSLEKVRNLSDVGLQRKGAMKRCYSPWRVTIEVDETTIKQEHHPLRRAHSADVLQNEIFPYNPDTPLIANYRIKKPEISHLARTKSIKAIIGPLTKEVCDQLNIAVESTKVAASVESTKVASL